MNIPSPLKLISICALLMTAQITYAKNWSELDCGESWVPTKSRAPVYPKRAQQMQLEGSIHMSFTITSDGKVEDINVVEASKKVFIRSATRAVGSLVFPPCIQNGLATKLTNVSIKYDFNLL